MQKYKIIYSQDQFLQRCDRKIQIRVQHNRFHWICCCIIHKWWFPWETSLYYNWKKALYFNSFGRYGNSPFIYPVWSLSDLAKVFSRLCALYGGAYMLNRDIEEIVYDENGNFRGIKSQGEEAYGKILITELSYVQKWNKVKSIGKVIRRIWIFDHPIPKTNDVASCQIILPQKQINRNNDILYFHCRS